MKKRLLVGISVFILSLSAIGQSPYYIAEQTITKYIIDKSEFQMQYTKYGNDSKFKYDFKWGADGYVRFYASYYWEDYITDKLDSVQGFYIIFRDWVGISKNEFIDTNETNKRLQFFYEWNYNVNDWDTVKIIERKRDSNNKEIFTIVFEKENEQWIPRYKEEHEYMKSRKVYTEYGWCREIENLIPQYKHEDEYNDKGQRVLWTSYNWNKSQNRWEPRSKAEFSYNTKGQEIRQVNYMPKDSVWIRSSKTETVKFNKNGQADLYIFYDWKESTHKWIEISRDDVKRRRENINLNKQKHWDDNLNTWIENTKTECQCDTLGREVLSISYQWDTTEKKWNPVSQKEIEYDDNNNPIFTRSHTWWQEKWILSETQESRYEKRE